MKTLFPLFVCVILVSGCASTLEKAQALDPAKVALDKANHDLNDSMKKLITPEPVAPAMGSAQTIVAFDAAAN